MAGRLISTWTKEVLQDQVELKLPKINILQRTSVATALVLSRWCYLAISTVYRLAHCSIRAGYNCDDEIVSMGKQAYVILDYTSTRAGLIETLYLVSVQFQHE